MPIRDSRSCYIEIPRHWVICFYSVNYILIAIQKQLKLVYNKTEQEKTYLFSLNKQKKQKKLIVFAYCTRQQQNRRFKIDTDEVKKKKKRIDVPMKMFQPAEFRYKKKGDLKKKRWTIFVLWPLLQRLTLWERMNWWCVHHCVCNCVSNANQKPYYSLALNKMYWRAHRIAAHTKIFVDPIRAHKTQHTLMRHTIDFSCWNIKTRVTRQLRCRKMIQTFINYRHKPIRLSNSNRKKNNNWYFNVVAHGVGSLYQRERKKMVSCW